MLLDEGNDFINDPGPHALVASLALSVCQGEFNCSRSRAAREPDCAHCVSCAVPLLACAQHQNYLLLHV